MPIPKKAAPAKSALSKPVQPDTALAAVVGKDPLPRTELTKKLWEYIRKHELQDPKDKRNVRADENLLAVFDGKKVVSMFEMTKLVNRHLV
jgi:upstream activation factor subunit UAF30